MIRIGLTACFMYPDPSRSDFGHRSLTFVENDMVNYFAREETLTVMIPDVSDELLDHYLDEVDGVVFHGGSDLAPESYKEQAIDSNRWPGDRYRDKYDLNVMDGVSERKLPVFGICRGFQLINVWYGGSLYQDLATQTGTTRVHRCAEEYDRINHSVNCVAGGVINGIYKKTNLQVNSVHHQGVKALGRGLVVEARCPDDDLIEAFTSEDMDDQYVLAVQWHPEFSSTLGDRIEDPAPLLDHFLEVVRSKKS